VTWWICFVVLQVRSLAGLGGGELLASGAETQVALGHTAALYYRLSTLYRKH
jgi:hypothetical protein